MKKFFKNEAVQIVLWVSSLIIAVILVSNLVVTGLKVIDPMPTAQESRHTSITVVEASPSYKELKQAVAKELKDAAATGARGIVMYVGAYDLDVRTEVERDLLWHGYKAELYSPLSGKNDFLKATW